MFPRLEGVVGLDVETCDPNLKELGPGGIRRDGHLAGISVHCGKFCGYYPIGHLGPGNLDKQAVIQWLRHELKNESLIVVGANLLYDVEWLASEGIEVRGQLFDNCTIDALIEEEAVESFSLSAMAQRHLNKDKDERLLREAASAYGVDPKSGLWKLPPKYVGPYAEQDARLAVQIREKQLIALAAQGLGDVLELELAVTPILWKMRRRGVRVDLAAAEKLGDELVVVENEMMAELVKIVGWQPDPWSNQSLAKLFDQLEIQYPFTANGNPSFKKDFLLHHENPVVRSISEWREVNRLRTTFVSDWVAKYVIGDRAYPVWRQIASDDGGTRTGRMASANPNMQQIPSRASVAAKVRAIFIPDEGTTWCKMDYSQQEPRLLVHYAATMALNGVPMDGSLDVRDAYRKDPKMDIYAMLAQMGNIDRRRAKGATLGRMYGMGAAKYAEQQGVSRLEGERILADFDARVPFVRALSDRCASLADTRGWIRTIGGRRRHFNLWEPRYNERNLPALPLPKAQREYGTALRRFGTRKALNALIQGSAADMTKRALVMIHNSCGLVPTLAVHDELDLCISSDAEAEACKMLAESAYQLQVPVIADCSVKGHWS